MTRKPQQQTLSIRISGTLRDFLERSKQVISSGSGESVSISDVAKTLLESAKDDRLDFRLEAAELQKSATRSLWNIRRKWEQEQDLSRAEWIFLSQYIQDACEGLAENPEMPTADSFAYLLEALLTVRGLRVERAVGLDRFYLENLGIEDGVALNDRQLDPEVVTRVVAKLIMDLRASPGSEKPVFAGRSFYVALRDEKLPDLVSLNKALSPYLGILFRLAARGHWIREQRPVRAVGLGRIIAGEIPSLTSGGIQLSFPVSSEGELSFRLQLRERDLTYPLQSYPEIREFMAILERVEPGRVWEGTHFYAYAGQETAEQPVHFSFWRHSDGVKLGFSLEEWQSLKDLFHKSLEIPALKMLFEELSLAYGDI